MQGSVFALMAYADEFGSDFNQDFRQAYMRQAEDGAPVSFLLKAAWAMAKGYSDAVPAFTEWIEPMGDVSLANEGSWVGWPRDVDAAISAEMFRMEVAAPKKKRRWKSGRVGHV
ncbi:MAG: hypothetical protein RR739_12060 [Clostridia bacterium]